MLLLIHAGIKIDPYQLKGPLVMISCTNQLLDTYCLFYTQMFAKNINRVSSIYISVSVQGRHNSSMLVLSGDQWRRSPTCHRYMAYQHTWFSIEQEFDNPYLTIGTEIYIYIYMYICVCVSSMIFVQKPPRRAVYTGLMIAARYSNLISEINTYSRHLTLVLNITLLLMFIIM